MNKITHAAAKKVFSGVVDYALGQVNKNPDEIGRASCRERVFPLV